VNWSVNASGKPFEASGKGFESSGNHFDCGIHDLQLAFGETNFTFVYIDHKITKVGI
jgi:hypothetical protein